MDVRVERVRQLERRGLRKARAVARSGGCGSTGGGGTVALASGPSGPDEGGPGRGADAPEAGAGPAPESDQAGVGNPEGGENDSGGVLDESSALAPPDLGTGGGRGESATGTSLWVAASLMLLAALAGFATPSLGDRLREEPTTTAGRP